jgi:hypothetical protein
MNLRFTVCRDYSYDGQPIVVIGVLVPEFVNPTVFQTEVVAAMLTALGVTSADVVVEITQNGKPYFNFANMKN